MYRSCSRRKSFEYNLKKTQEAKQISNVTRPKDYSTYLLENYASPEELIQARHAFRFEKNQTQKVDYYPLLPPVYW